MSRENLAIVQRVQAAFEAGGRGRGLRPPRARSAGAGPGERPTEGVMSTRSSCAYGPRTSNAGRTGSSGSFTPSRRVLHQSGIGKGSGARVDLRYGAVIQLQEGRLVRTTLYLDPYHALEAAGLSE